MVDKVAVVGSLTPVENKSSDAGLQLQKDTTDSAHGTPRRRSKSVATDQPSVETVVVKAKRAASTLWTLLHAQNCAQSENNCPHPGCPEAKLLHLHLKTCPAGGDFTCPTHYNGCDQARKLLAHYKRCRSIRARQMGQMPSRRETGQPHVCLVCSLVARQARSTLERTVAPSTTRKPSSRKVVSSFMLDADNQIIGTNSSTNGKMLPPPPRPVVPPFEAPTKNHLEPPSLWKAARSSLNVPNPLDLATADTTVLSVNNHSNYLVDTRDVPQGRARSASCTETPKPLVQRQRSASAGDSLLLCETIEEDDGSHGSKDSVGINFRLDLA